VWVVNSRYGAAHRSDHATRETDREVVKAIVGIARSLNKLTIAEGVENGETLELLRALGVDQAQRFFIHRPQAIAQRPPADR
jgi:EAL domain-containing protein (putative c-di-GMP-specific phosphodiesterase class I)